MNEMARSQLLVLLQPLSKADCRGGGGADDDRTLRRPRRDGRRRKAEFERPRPGYVQDGGAKGEERGMFTDSTLIQGGSIWSRTWVG